MPNSSLDQFSEISASALDDFLYTIQNAGGVDYKVQAAKLFGAMLPSICQGRLTLASGFPEYAPQPKTPSSTDTGTEVATFSAAHGWITGTMITPVSTVGNLTVGTNYYINALSATTCAFYTTLANALADTSRVNLSASLTQLLKPIGIENSTIYFSPLRGNRICLHSGTAWQLFSFAEISLALGTLTSGVGYDVFAYNNSGVVALEILAWTSGILRATALASQDGVLVKSGDTTRRYLGSFYSISTAATADTKARRLVYNEYNKIGRVVGQHSTDATWTYSSATIRQANGNAANQIEVFIGNVGPKLRLELDVAAAAGTVGSFTVAGFGEDSTTTFMNPSDGSLGKVLKFQLVSAREEFYEFTMEHFPPLGRHVYSWNENGDNAVTYTIQGTDNSFRRSGIHGSIDI